MTFRFEFNSTYTYRSRS